MTPTKLKKDKKVKEKIMKLPIVWIATGLIVFVWAIIIWIDTRPIDGIGYLRKYVLADASYLEGAEPISAERNTIAMDYDVHIKIKIQEEQAKKMVENNVLKRCVDGVSEYGGYHYLCSDPIWGSSSMMNGMYPTSGEDVLCTISWPDLSSLSGDIPAGVNTPSPDDVPNHESTSYLCVNPNTGELWYSHYSY